ncbi:MAG: SDR family NAD(P)-dependent oxidoreductase [Bacteroidales bacterium]
MRDLQEVYGSWALVAGAAEGLGQAYAVSLAQKGFGLVLVDQQEEPLQQLAKELEGNYGIQVRVLLLDLADRDASEAILSVIEETSCRLLIYNAAFSRVRRFSENSQEDLDRYVEVNVRTPLLLVHAFIAHFRETSSRRKGIILMSSLAGSWGSRLLAPYGATKAFTQVLAESLSHEWKGEGFDILVSITGATATPGYLSSLPDDRKPPGTVMEPGSVPEEVFRALGKRSFVIPGFSNKLVYFLLSRILPRRISLGIMDRSVARLYRKG